MHAPIDSVLFHSVPGFIGTLCDPINKDAFSTTVDVPDVNTHGVNCLPVSNKSHGVDCLPVSNKSVQFGDQDIRCVCDTPVNFTSTV